MINQLTHPRNRSLHSGRVNKTGGRPTTTGTAPQKQAPVPSTDCFAPSESMKSSHLETSTIKIPGNSKLTALLKIAGGVASIAAAPVAGPMIASVYGVSEMITGGVKAVLFDNSGAAESGSKGTELSVREKVSNFSKDLTGGRGQRGDGVRELISGTATVMAAPAYGTLLAVSKGISSIFEGTADLISLKSGRGSEASSSFESNLTSAKPTTTSKNGPIAFL